MKMPRVDSYRFGRVVVDGEAYTRDLIILPERVIPNWWREQGHYLQPGDLAPVLEERLQVLVVGQGAMGRMSVAPEAERALADAGVELLVQWSGPACDMYNELRARKRTALALHLTC